MTHKIKSTLYFASLVIALITYYTMDSQANPNNTQMANNNTIEQIASPSALN